MDEQTIGFQCNCGDKIGITCKAKGVGFQVYALCGDRFPYKFYSRNKPSLKKYIDQGVSDICAQVMLMRDKLHNKYHRV